MKFPALKLIADSLANETCGVYDYLRVGVDLEKLASRFIAENNLWAFSDEAAEIRKALVAYTKDTLHLAKTVAWSSQKTGGMTDLQISIHQHGFHHLAKAIYLGPGWIKRFSFNGEWASDNRLYLMKEADNDAREYFLNADKASSEEK